MSRQTIGQTVIGNLKQQSNLYTKAYPQPVEVEQFSFADLQEVTQMLQSDVDVLDEESLMLEAYLQAAEESRQAPGGRGIADDFSTDVPSGGAAWRTGESHERRDSATTSLESHHYLSLEDKQNMAAQRTEAMKSARDAQQEEMENAMDKVRAVMEEAEANIQEIRMDTTHFKREITNEKKISGDKILKYFEERPKEKEDHLRKLEEKTKTLATQIAKQSKQLDSQDGKTEALRPIDFDQLRIENQQFLERIKMKNDDLMFLKQSTMETVQVLNSQTEKLNKLTAEQTRLNKDIDKREQDLKNYTKEIENVLKKLAIAKQKHLNLKAQHEAVKVPKVDDYIQQKAEMYELDKAAANWKRKVEIAQGQLSVIRQQITAAKKTLEGTLTTKK